MRFFIALTLLSCGAAPAALRVKSVSPAHIGVSDAAKLEITGQGFEPVVSVDLDSSGRTNENTAFSAVMRSASDTFPLAVTYASTTTLHAQTPSALPPGVYALWLTTPDGHVTSLDDAIEVAP